MKRPRRQRAKEREKASERKHPEAPGAAGSHDPTTRDLPASVWLPPLESTSPRETHDPSGRSDRQTRPSQTEAAARWMSISQGAQAVEPAGPESIADDPPAAPGQWIPVELKPEANPLATGAWLRPDDDGEAGPVEAPAKPIVAEPTSAKTSTKPSPEGPERVGGGEISGGYGGRTRAAVAYCRELFPADVARASAEQILNSLSGGISDDRVLLELTRTAAAGLLERSRVEAGADDRASDCKAIFGRLAARANGTLEAADRSRLEQHLASCIVCKAAELRAARADRAFAATLGLTLHLRDV